MAELVRMTWDGLDELEALFTAYETGVPQRVAQIMDNLEPEAETYMDALTPVDTGYLLSRNVVQSIAGGFTLSNDAPYFVYVNYGTRYQPAQPMLEPTIEHIKQAMTQRLPDALDV